MTGYLVQHQQRFQQRIKFLQRFREKECFLAICDKIILDLSNFYFANPEQTILIARNIPNEKIKQICGY